MTARSLCLVSLLAAACASPAGPGLGGGGTGAFSSAGAAGSPCAPAMQNEGCLYAGESSVRMRCDTVAKAWQTVAACPTGEFCSEAPDPAAGDGPHRLTECILPWQPPVAADADAGPGTDTAIAGQDAAAAPDVPEPDVTPEPGAKPTFFADGGFTAVVDGKAVAVDYAGLGATAGLKHRPAEGGVVACIPTVSLAVAHADGTCRLELGFQGAKAGAPLALTSARFHARSAKGTCAKWVAEAGTAPVVYEKAAGGGQIDAPAVDAGLAGKLIVSLSGLTLAPSGVVTMKAGSRQFQLDLAQLPFHGSAVSLQTNQFSCGEPPVAQVPLPEWKLPDVQPKSAEFNKVYGLQAFQGKRIVVLAGAGWCSSCVAQVKSMEKIRKQFEAQGKTGIQFVALNDSSAAANKANLTSICNFPVFQGSWSVHKAVLYGKSYTAKKNDAFAYDETGKLVGFFQGAGTVWLNLFEDFLVKNLGAPAGGNGYDCLLNGTKRAPCAPANH